MRPNIKDSLWKNFKLFLRCILKITLCSTWPQLCNNQSARCTKSGQKTIELLFRDFRRLDGWSKFDQSLPPPTIAKVTLMQKVLPSPDIALPARPATFGAQSKESTYIRFSQKWRLKKRLNPILSMLPIWDEPLVTLTFDFSWLD